jgi:hypothetical protein
LSEPKLSEMNPKQYPVPGMPFAAGKVKRPSVFMSEEGERLREKRPFSDSDYAGLGLMC